MKKNFLSLSIVLLTGLLINLSAVHASGKGENNQDEIAKKEKKNEQTQ